MAAPDPPSTEPGGAPGYAVSIAVLIEISLADLAILDGNADGLVEIGEISSSDPNTPFTNTQKITLSRMVPVHA